VVTVSTQKYDEPEGLENAKLIDDVGSINEFSIPWFNCFEDKVVTAIIY
jgi:hypothetical protein